MEDTEFRTEGFDDGTLEFLSKYEMGELLGLCATFFDFFIFC